MVQPIRALDGLGPIEILRVDREEALGALNFEIQAALGD